MDVMRASASIDELIEHRAREKSSANELEAMYRESACRHLEKKRRANRAAWYTFFLNMADSHRRLSESYERRAEALCGEDGN